MALEDLDLKLVPYAPDAHEGEHVCQVGARTPVGCERARYSVALGMLLRVSERDLTTAW